LVIWGAAIFRNPSCRPWQHSCVSPFQHKSMPRPSFQKIPV